MQQPSTPASEIATPALATSSATEDHPLRGILTLVTGLSILPCMDAIAKHLAGHLPVLEITWGRYVFYALALVPFAFKQHRATLLRPSRPGLQLLRGSIMAFSALMFFSSVKYMPLADSMAVFFVYPFLILLGSAWLLHEPVGKARWVLVLIGFIGTLLVVHPALGGISIGVAFSLASGIAYASAMLVTRRLAAHDPSLMTAALTALIGVVIYSVVIPFTWVQPAAADWPLLALMGFIAAIGHFMIVQAHRLATASQLAPYGYTEIVSAIVIGLIAFGDIPSPIVWLGIALIVASGIAAMRLKARA